MKIAPPMSVVVVQPNKEKGNTDDLHFFVFSSYIMMTTLIVLTKMMEKTKYFKFYFKICMTPPRLCTQPAKWRSSAELFPKIIIMLMMVVIILLVIISKLLKQIIKIIIK